MATGSVGIINQGATCYLNSLLQTLYHIGAFRRAVYRIPSREDEEPRSSISVSLQKLFFWLQRAPSAPQTSDLTHAFGWDTLDAFQQHDVQELARVLMDALEKKVRRCSHRYRVGT